MLKCFVVFVVLNKHIYWIAIVILTRGICSFVDCRLSSSAFVHCSFVDWSSSSAFVNICSFVDWSSSSAFVNFKVRLSLTFCFCIRDYPRKKLVPIKDFNLMWICLPPRTFFLSSSGVSGSNVASLCLAVCFISISVQKSNTIIMFSDLLIVSVSDIIHAKQKRMSQSSELVCI